MAAVRQNLCLCPPAALALCSCLELGVQLGLEGSREGLSRDLGWCSAESSDFSSVCDLKTLMGPSQTLVSTRAAALNCSELFYHFCFLVGVFLFDSVIFFLLFFFSFAEIAPMMAKTIKAFKNRFSRR